MENQHIFFNKNEFLNILEIHQQVLEYWNNVVKNSYKQLIEFTILEEILLKKYCLIRYFKKGFRTRDHFLLPKLSSPDKFDMIDNYYEYQNTILPQFVLYVLYHFCIFFGWRVSFCCLGLLC